MDKYLVWHFMGEYRSGHIDGWREQLIDWLLDDQSPFFPF